MDYFELAALSDNDAYLAQFTDDAVVEDESRERHGIEAIRAWREEVPMVRYDVLSDDGESAVVEVSGEFPGSPVTLTYAFARVPDGRIDRLSIRT